MKQRPSRASHDAPAHRNESPFVLARHVPHKLREDASVVAEVRCFCTVLWGHTAGGVDCGRQVATAILAGHLNISQSSSCALLDGTCRPFKTVRDRWIPRLRWSWRGVLVKKVLKSWGTLSWNWDYTLYHLIKLGTFQIDSTFLKSNWSLSKPNWTLFKSNLLLF